MRHTQDYTYAQSAAVPSHLRETCLVWIRFSSSRHERLPDSGEPFFVALSRIYREETKFAEKRGKEERSLALPGAPRGKKNMDIKQLTEEMNRLVRSKGWYADGSKRPQTPRNLAISLAVEAAEILEHFQWRDEVKEKQELSSELADVALYLLQLASVTEIDLEQAILDKIEINKRREWDED